MIAALLALTAVFGLLLFAEYLRRQKHLKGEASRKFVHITVGTFVAFWPFFLPFTTIRLIAAAFFIGVVVTRYTSLFPAIHDVQRKTWGDLLFPLGIILTSLITNSSWIFTAALLHLSLADGVAAIVGTNHGHRGHSYKVLNHHKTVVGSFLFFVLSLTITAWVVWLAPASLAHVGLPLVLILPFVATALENLAVFGSDNIVVPVAVAYILVSLQTLA